MNKSGFRLPSTSLRASLLQSAKAYHQDLAGALSYLLTRGISEDTARRFRLGFAGFPEPGHDQMAGRLSIPYLTPDGVVDIKFRCVQGHECKSSGCVKYLCLPGSTPRLFGVRNLALNPDRIAVCEGEMDAMVATQAGIPAVGVGGAATWKRHYKHVLEGFAEVIVLADGDDAGGRLAEVIAGEVYAARVIQMPAGEDVASYVLAHGEQKLREIVA